LNFKSGIHSSSDIGARFGKFCKDGITFGNSDDAFKGDNVVCVIVLEINGTLEGDNTDDSFERDDKADGAFEVLYGSFDILQN